MKKNIAYLIVALIIIGGTIYYLNRSPKTVNSFLECSKYYPVMESYPARCVSPDGKSFTEDIGNELEKKNLISLDSPRPNQSVQSPLEIRGRARGNWFFEASFPAKLVDGNGKVIATVPIMTSENWMTTEFVNFSGVINFAIPDTATGTLILEKDNPSGLPANADSLIVPVKFGQFGAKDPNPMTVKVYFPKAGDADVDCAKVNEVVRTIPKTSRVGEAAINELLEGPTAEEKLAGFASSINQNVKLQKISIENGVARVDFSPELGYQVGGSCRVTSIRSQISSTLKQFPTVREVIISINSEVDEILQP